MKTVVVELGELSYPIYIGRNLLTEQRLYSDHIDGNSIMLVSNTTVAPLYANIVLAATERFKSGLCALQDGEQYKNLDALEHIIEQLLSERFDRHTTLVALGGGVVGDTCGFAAASFQRGVNFIQVPTTLLAMVDSSVGGKTAVNHRLGKNMIGAFHQPKAVLIDTATLDTLPEREFKAGLAEVIKYGLILDAEFFSWLENNLGKLLARDQDTLIHAIETSCKTKANIVAQDETEQGIRAILNLGHTFGHAIETAMGYGEWLHGEAISTGMVLAARLSAQLGWIDEALVSRTTTLFEAAGLPTHIPESMTADSFHQHMAVDKKVKNGVLRLILLRGLGEAVIADSVTTEEISRVINTHPKG